MAKRHYSSMPQGDYAGELARRTQEMQDAGMIKEDRSAIANLPQDVMIKPYAKSPSSYMPENLNDDISGVDHQMNALDGSKRNAHLVPKKV